MGVRNEQSSTRRRLSDAASASPELSPTRPRATWPHAGRIGAAYGLARQPAGAAAQGRVSVRHAHLGQVRSSSAPSLVLEPWRLQRNIPKRLFVLLPAPVVLSDLGGHGSCRAHRGFTVRDWSQLALFSQAMISRNRKMGCEIPEVSLLGSA